MGRGDMKSAKGKRCRGSYGKTRNQKKLKARVKAALRRKPAPAAVEQPKTEATA
jgi:ribosomal small subunit protein bTHX